MAGFRVKHGRIPGHNRLIISPPAPGGSPRTMAGCRVREVRGFPRNMDGFRVDFFYHNNTLQILPCELWTDSGLNMDRFRVMVVCSFPPAPGGLFTNYGRLQGEGSPRLSAKHGQIPG